jgi:hypothetical protein
VSNGLECGTSEGRKKRELLSRGVRWLHVFPFSDLSQKSLRYQVALVLEVRIRMEK